MQGLDASSSPNYLGRYPVVLDLVRLFVLDDVARAKFPFTLTSACRRMAKLFLEGDARHPAIPGGQADLCKSLCRRLGIDPGQTPEQIVQCGFMDLADEVLKAGKLEDEKAGEKLVHDLIVFHAHLLTGTADLHYS